MEFENFLMELYKLCHMYLGLFYLGLLSIKNFRHIDKLLAIISIQFLSFPKSWRHMVSKVNSNIISAFHNFANLPALF